MFGTVQDVTERARAERELAASEARYRELLEQTSDGVWRVEVEQRTSYVNARMAEMLGYTPDEMLGRELSDSWTTSGSRPQSRRSRVIAAMPRARCSKSAFGDKDGGACWARVSTTALLDGDGNYTGSLAIICDVTAAKAREAELLRPSGSFRRSPTAWQRGCSRSTARAV